MGMECRCKTIFGNRSQDGVGGWCVKCGPVSFKQAN